VELKPCPFCGEIPEYQFYNTNTDNEKHYIECDCGVELCDFAKNTLYKHWNTRANPTALLKELEEVVRQLKKSFDGANKDIEKQNLEGIQLACAELVISNAEARQKIKQIILNHLGEGK